MFKNFPDELAIVLVVALLFGGLFGCAYAGYSYFGSAEQVDAIMYLSNLVLKYVLLPVITFVVGLWIFRLPVRWARRLNGGKGITTDWMCMLYVWGGMIYIVYMGYPVMGGYLSQYALINFLWIYVPWTVLLLLMGWHGYCRRRHAFAI